MTVTVWAEFQLAGVNVNVAGLTVASPVSALATVSTTFVSGSASSTTVAVIFMIWSILVGMSDALLKPLLLGRGVKVPMLIILIGAIGGMISAGIIGLFVGAVVLALGYELFKAWLKEGPQPTERAEAEATAPTRDP